MKQVIKVILYGDLKKRARKLDDATETIGSIEFEESELDTIQDVMKHLDIDIDEVSHIFLNREYSHHEREIDEGDRLALFPKDMALLYKWYFSEEK